MNALERIAKALSREAGQERRAWLDEKLGQADRSLGFFLGPTGIPDKLRGIGGLLNYTDAGDMTAAADASRNVWNNPTIGNAAELAAAAGAVAIPFVGARMMNDGVDVIGDAIRSGKDDIVRFAADESGALPVGRGENLTPAQAKAQEVLDLLNQGRASEVTDDMMAAADDMYLAQNYDLPMDEASRMGRARDMGFDTDTPLYHGTKSPDNFAELNPSQRGKIGPGVYLTPAPNRASVFAGSDQASILAREQPLHNARVMPLLATNRPADDAARSAARAARDNYQGDHLAAYKDAFGARGFDGVSIQDERTILDPANIRSRFARFDPRLSHLRNLSAGIGGLAAPGLMAASQDDSGSEQQARALRKYLERSQ